MVSIYQLMARLLGGQGKRQSPLMPELATDCTTIESPKLVTDSVVPDGFKPTIKRSRGQLNRKKTHKKVRSKRSL